MKRIKMMNLILTNLYLIAIVVIDHYCLNLFMVSLIACINIVLKLQQKVQADKVSQSQRQTCS